MFSKSRVSRFGEKHENAQLPQGVTTSDISSRRRCVSASHGEGSNRKTIAVKSFVDTGGGSISTSTRSSLSSKIGKPVSRPSSVNRSTFQEENQQNLAEQPSITDRSDEKTCKKTDSISSMECNSLPESDCFKPRPSTTSKIPNPIPITSKTGDFQRRNMEYQFNLKMKRFNILKKEILDKQKPAIDLYRNLNSLRKRIKEHNGKCLSLEEFRVVEFSEIGKLSNKELQENMNQIKAKLESIPSTFMVLCRKILEEKCVILDSVFDEEGDWNQDDLLKKIQIYKLESTSLEDKIEEKLKEEEHNMKELMKKWNSFTLTHLDNEVNKQENESKIEELEQKLKQVSADVQFERNKKLKEIERNKELEKDLTKMKEKVQEVLETLDEEKSKNNSIQSRIDNFELKLKTAKGRMKEAEKEKQEYELKYEGLQAKYKKAEENWQAKDSQIQILQNHMKTQTDIEIATEPILSEKDYKEKCRQVEQKYEELIDQLQRDLQDMNKQKTKLMQDLESIKRQQKNSEQAEKKFTICNIPDESSLKSDTEIFLWTELRATKSALKLAEEKLVLYNEEKHRFLETLRKEDDTETLNMTTHLMKKEEMISNLILQNRRLKKKLHELQEEFESKKSSCKELQEKMCYVNNDLLENQNIQIYELQQKLHSEMTRTSIIEQDLIKISTEKEQLMNMIKNFQYVFNIREHMLQTYKEKQQATEDQNLGLKDYILQMRDQLSLISLEQTKKEQLIKTLNKLLDDKTAYIEKIEERIDELETSVHSMKSKRVNLNNQLNNLDKELKVTRTKLTQLSKR